MRIGIDFRPALFGGAGIGRYTRELCCALPPLLQVNEALALYSVAYSRPEKERIGPKALIEHPKVTLVQCRFPSRLLHILGRFGLLGLEIFTGRIDLFHYTDFVYPPLKNTPYVFTLYDLLFMDQAGFNTPRFCRTMANRVRTALQGACGVMVPSKAVYGDLKRFFPWVKAPVKIVTMGGDHLPSPRAQPGMDGLSPGRFLLSVGTYEPRKNRVRLIKAFEDVVKDYPWLRLVLVGRKGWLEGAFDQELSGSSVMDKILVLREVDDSVLSWLYGNALALVYPSLGEGFGLPVAEAMHLGCPVITSDRSSLPEVAGGAALLVDPLDEKAIASAMRQVAGDDSVRKELAQAGKERAKRLMWRHTAAKTLSFYREIAAPWSAVAADHG